MNLHASPSLSRTLRRVVALAGLLTLLAACTGAGDTDDGAGQVEVRVLSTRADLVSGGDALIGVSGLEPGSDVTVLLNGDEVAEGFDWRSSGSFEGVLTGLVDGDNVVEAAGPDGAGARLEITNHPIGGPLFSGPQIEPWPCTEGAEDEQCNRPPQRSYLAYSTAADACATDGAVQPYDATGSEDLGDISQATACFVPYDPANPPADIPTVAGPNGDEQPFVVFYEQLWQDRDQVFVAHLASPETPLDPWTEPDDSTWNRRLLVTQGGACGAHHGEATGRVPPAIEPDGAPSVLDVRALAKGFMVLSTALNSNHHNCNVALQAESLVMAKEYIADTYGPITYTVGLGCSGGSMSQNQVANAYPGIYQGIITACTMPDAITPAPDVYDCDLFLRHFAAHGGWTDEQQAAVGGKLTTNVCNSWVNVFPFWNVMLPEPTTPEQSGGGVFNFQNCGIPVAEAYDAETNPNGPRCGMFDWVINLIGRDPATGFAYRTIDNTGVQYGLDALEAGVIAPQQFADLNASIGGFDGDYQWQPQRSKAPSKGLANAYRTGLVNSATHLDQVAIIDEPLHAEDIHEPYRSYAIRARIDAAHGSHENQVIWDTERDVPDRFDTMIEWLDAIEADKSGRSLAEKIVHDKPDEAVDIIDRTTGTGTRDAAGGPLSSDILKCALQPLDRADYAVEFTDEEWSSLQATFPAGVCDWRKTGIKQQPTVAWLDYSTGPRGEPMAKAPESQPTQR